MPEPVLLRPRVAGAVRVDATGDRARSFHASVPGYVPTPLRDATRSALALGVGEVLVKDESSRLGLPSFKALGAFWGVHRALQVRLGARDADVATFAGLRQVVAAHPPVSLSAATDGNHGRAVARAAALLGLPARIYVPQGTARARIEAIGGEGATVTVIDGGYDDAVRRSAQDAGEDCLVVSDTSWKGYEDIPAVVVEGYATIFAELEEQLKQSGRERPDLVVVPIGVGALAAAAVRHFWSAPTPRPRLVGVEPVSAACVLESVRAGHMVSVSGPQDSMMAGLNCATPSSVAWPLVSGGIDAYLAVDEPRVPAAMRQLAADGVVAGETGAAALAGLARLMDDGGERARDALKLGGDARVLVLCTEGATDPDAYRRLVGAPADRDASARL